jgi:hypothetical protein
MRLRDRVEPLMTLRPERDELHRLLVEHPPDHQNRHDDGPSLWRTCATLTKLGAEAKLLGLRDQDAWFRD